MRTRKTATSLSRFSFPNRISFEFTCIIPALYRGRKISDLMNGKNSQCNTHDMYAEISVDKR